MRIETTTVQVYCGGPEGYSKAFTGEIQPGQWQRTKAELPLGVGDGAVRIDIADLPSLIDLAAIVLRNPANEKILWTINNAADLSSLRTNETTERLSGAGTETETKKFCRYTSAAAPARFFLPAFDAADFDEPLELEIWLRVHLDIAAVLPLLRCRDGSRELDSLKLEHQAISAEHKALQAANRKLQGELYVSRIDAKREQDKLRDEAAFLQERLTNSFQALNESLEKLNNIKPEDTGPLVEAIAELERQLAASAANNKKLILRQQELEQTLAAMTQSRSWRLTSPLRKLMGRG